jgi:carbon storage regulator
MLVLTRRIGEELLIAGNIRVRVVTARGNQVRLGITAPATVPLARLELLAEPRPPRPRGRGTKRTKFLAEVCHACER